MGKPTKEWLIKAVVKKRGEVIVKGRDEEEALANFDKLNWEYEDWTETIDWEARGEPEENK